MTITTAVSVEERRALARVPLDEPRGVLGRLLAWYARRTYGDVPDNGLALLHHKPILKALLGFERRVDKIKEVPRWRESEAFTPVERRVLEYAEAMTATPPTVTDAMADALRADLGVDGFLELTMMVAVENERSRFNSALGLTTQGFSDRCELAP